VSQEGARSRLWSEPAIRGRRGARPAIAWLLCVCALLVSASCFGDLSHPVLYENATSARVTIYPRGREYPGVKRVLDAGATQKDNLLVSNMNPDTFVARIEAVDDAGLLVFCRRYTNGDLDHLGDRITVHAGEITC